MKNKINRCLVCIAVLAVIATTICITIVYYGFFQRQIRSDLKVSGEILRDAHYFDEEQMPVEEIHFPDSMKELRVTWVDAEGRVLYDNSADYKSMENHANRPEIANAMEQGEGETVRKSDTLHRNTFYYALLLDNGTVLRVATEAENIQAIFLTALPLIVIIMAIIVVACITISHVLTKQLLSPIESMAKNIEEAAEMPRYGELVPFAKMIRQQHADILSAAKARQDFTANVSHELKTPLTAISGYTELIQNHMVDEKQQEHFIEEIQKNVNRLLSLINDIIRLSELDRTEDEQLFDTIDLYEIVEECMDSLQVNAARRKVKVYFSGEHVNIRANREMTRELVDNLVQNAIRYNNEGGSVWVSVKKDAAPTLCVKDDGIGIPADEQERIFERFYRVDKSRSRETGGTGLGLAIVKHIVEIHDAKISVQSQVGAGTEITVTY